MDSSDIHKGHRNRLRERAQREGLDAFAPHEVIELLLFYAIPRQDVSEIAHILIQRFGTVKGVLTASVAELSTVKGVGTRAAEWLCCIGELMESYCDLLEEKPRRICNCRQAMGIASVLCKNAPSPSTYQICTSPTGVILLFGNVCDGLVWAEPTAMRKCLADALSVHARSILLIECVEDELPCADAYEKNGARRYAETLNAMGMELLDVILIGKSDLQSMVLDGEYDPRLYGEARSALSEDYLKEDSDESPYEGET